MFETDNTEILATETFSQWVIEDKFAGAKPPIDVQFVDDVRPFEEMKLRLLNASHSMIAYAGLRKGYRFVHEAIRDNEIRSRVEELYREVTPLVHPPDGYTSSLLQRFDNERLPHQLKQIAMDGSQKLKQRIVPSLKQTRDHRALVSVIEDWAHVCYETTPDDPLKAKIESLKSKTFPEFQRELRSLIEAP
jgi:fructuronate reductase